MNITQHQCRHTYASMPYQSEIDIKNIQNLLGHKSVRTTLDIYTHLEKEFQIKKLDVLKNNLDKKIEEMGYKTKMDNSISLYELSEQMKKENM